ncbi:heme lyase CcmF/NrfE family subunit [Desulfonatronovibrio magnus]|uniref:heme lyase CcmF/NrfE family subunit n=1 Tax=Desulfonatronovibrio magnus TaxID=698827 RepID=UPI0005EACB76|nr:cytochrome c-type biogenesis CcmF C-terminal domain-containing protein [Desulfonatronovibrio magnus]
MQYIGFFILLISLLIYVVMGLFFFWEALRTNEKDRLRSLAWMEKSHIAAFMIITLASLILLQAFWLRDYSFSYVFRHSDDFLPMVYRVSAFWAGQAGSMLFWLWIMALMGFIWIYSPVYKSLPERTKGYFWGFFFMIQAFFLLMLTGPSNPFEILDPVPMSGRGLNPLLQNVGMIFHPPMTFLGYAGFTIPACLALAGWVTGDQRSWLFQSRNWVLFAWVMLTGGGILLGGWWAYMELGWGGYWAWDPVENASLIPWLVSTAFLHTAMIGKQRNTLHRSNLILICMSLITCFFATFLVRSNVIDSLHTFGGTGVGVPLVSLIGVSLIFTFFVALTGKSDKSAVDDFWSKQGLMIVTTWLLLALAVIVAMGTMWPVISRIWTDSPIGLGPDFYNRVCLPVFTLMAIILCICPWYNWKSGVKDKNSLIIVGIVFVCTMIGLWIGGIRVIMPVVAAAAGVAGMLSAFMYIILTPQVRKRRVGWNVYLLHLGVAMIVFGVAFSGPFQDSREFVIPKGERVTMQNYEFHYIEFEEILSPGLAIYEARLVAYKDGREIGMLTPQRKLFHNFDSPYAEVSVIPTLGNELYSTILAFNQEKTITVKINITPLVNWIWIGSIIVCVAGLLIMSRVRVRKVQEMESA